MKLFSRIDKEMEVNTFDDLKSLIILKSFKKHAPAVVREHFIREWLNLKILKISPKGYMNMKIPEPLLKQAVQGINIL